MSREKLAEAADVLEAAASDADDDLAERLRGQADQLAKLADRSSGPDHGRLARHMHTLSDLADDADGDLADEIQRAYDLVEGYRSTVSGV
ncbi:DUF7553 family protein [Halospeciosus flavus]|uniref:Uncharacterized protein n=1 Tax=Halospeciosus flavus TaxID=3032283 RepID=A0ABD5Z771_9EURY|nr:hypothetical protein [Halospeciosus flavus]